MRVLQINSVCGVGSTGRIATDIHQILLEQGYESYIAYGRGEALNCDNAIKIGNKFDNYAHVAKTRILDRHGFGSKKATLEFIRKIEELNPDIIHLHNIHGYYINIEILFDYLKKANKPVVWTLHDCWSFTGHCSYFDYVGCTKWKDGCYDCPEKKEYPTSLLMDSSKSNYNQKKEIFTDIENLIIITPSKWLASLVKESFLREYPVKVINNGIDLDIFKPTNSNFIEKNNLEDKFIILGVASIWERRKGLNYFLKLANEIEKDEIIVLVGVTEKQKKTFPSNILGITRTNNVQELAELYAVADVFVNPTLEDNFPTTNLEALACETPVVGFATGGSIESIEAGNGIIVEKENLEHLLKSIKKVKDNDAFQPSLERVQRLYDKDIKFHEYIELYKSVKSISFLRVE